MSKETMRAAVFLAPGCIELKDVEIPVLKKSDQLLVEVEACSICGTDVHIVANPPGYIATPNTILGHEFCGIVKAVGEEVRGFLPGDRIVVNPNNYCGTCYFCKRNLPNQCEHIEALGIDYDGAFAKYCVISEKVAHKISKNVDRGVAACVEPLACVINGLSKVHITPSDSAVVVGAGPIGMIMAMMLKRNGIESLYILETSQNRIEFANNLNLGRVINPLTENAAEIIKQETVIGADFVFDMTGSQIDTSISLVRKNGIVVLFGVNKQSQKTIAQSEITTKEISVIGTWLANATFPKAVQVVEEHAIDLTQIITDVYTLSDIKLGLEKLASGQAMKIIILPE